MRERIVSEVDQFLNQFVGNGTIRTDVLIIAGPPGAGKYSMVHALCRTLQIGIKEFSQVNIEQTSWNEWRRRSDNNNESHIVEYESRLKSFDRFLYNRQFCALDFGNGPPEKTRVHLVSELPMTHNNHQMKEKLFEILRRNCLSSSPKRNPVVIIHNVYDSASLRGNLRKCFPKEFFNAPNVHIVEVKGFTAAAIRSILNDIISKERSKRSNVGYNFPSLVQSSALDDIITKSNGDLRHAINQLQFICIRQSRSSNLLNWSKEAENIITRFRDFQFDLNDNYNDDNDHKDDNVHNHTNTSNDDDSMMKRSTKKNSKDNMDNRFQRRNEQGFATVRSRQALMQSFENDEIRDPVIDIHHATARVLYGKRTASGHLDFDLEHNVLRSVYSNDHTLVSYIHNNVLNFCDSIEDVSDILENFSYGDMFCNRRLFETGGVSYNQPRLNADYQNEPLSIYSFLISCYGVLYHNQKNRSKNRFRNIYAPKFNRVNLDARDLKEQLLTTFSNDGASIRCQQELLDIVPYEHLIYNICQNKRESMHGASVHGRSATLLQNRAAKMAEFSREQLQLLNRIHNYVFRSELRHGIRNLPPALANDDDYEEQDDDNDNNNNIALSQPVTSQPSGQNEAYEPLGQFILPKQDPSVFIEDDITEM